MEKSKTEAYLNEIRALDGLKNAILSEISVNKRLMRAEFRLVTDRAYSTAEEETARTVSQSYLPEAFTATVKIIKRVPDREILKRRIYEFVGSRFPAAASFLREEDVEVELLGSGARFCFDVASGEQSLFSSGKILDEVSAYLKTVFCGSFYGNVRLVEKEEEEIFEEDVPEEEEKPLPTRFFKIENYERFIGGDTIPKYAAYVADCNFESENLTVCGELTYFQEKLSKKGKTYYSLTVTDGSGSLRASFFPKKAVVEKLAELKTGDWVVLTGVNEDYNGSLSFTAKAIDFGTPPEGYEFEKKPSKPVPRAYHAVFPEPYVDYSQAGFFDIMEKPAALKENVFVVFDLETTGLNNNPAMGKMDRIIEIGAVKLVNGEIKEKFSSFVACPDRLSREIVELTGIQDSDLVGAPTVEQVIPDFFKFCEGAYLVGHNVQFDYRFVRYYGEEQGYAFEHQQFDTLTLAQEVLRGTVANYKLNTIAAHYGFEFNHHRAFEDAGVTAKIFIELVRAKGKL